MMRRKQQSPGRREITEEKRGGVGNVLRWIAIILCALVFLCCAAYLIRLGVEAYQQKQDSKAAVERFVSSAVDRDFVAEDDGQEDVEVGDDETDETDESDETEYAVSSAIDFDALMAASPYVVGWIQVSGIDVINYPIVQYTDNSHFLTHSWDNQYIRYGAIFLDAAIASDFSEPYSIIYGHYMKNGTMFGSLKKYQNASFFAENGGVITIYLPTETRVYQLFSVHIVDPSDAGVYTIGFAAGETFGEYLQAMADASIYDTGISVSGEDHVITLSTCSGSDRLVLHAKLVAVYPAS